jgi:hypothetical protein
VNGPGAVSVDVELLEFDLDHVLWFEMGQSVQIELELDVLHAVRPLTVDVTLQRVEDDWDSYDSERQHETTVWQWTFNHPGRRMHKQS